MHSFTADTAPLLPVFHEYAGTQFCFSPTSDLYTHFPRGTKGTATVRIHFLRLNVTGGDAPGNSALFQEVIDDVAWVKVLQGLGLLALQHPIKDGIPWFVSHGQKMFNIG